MKKQRSELERTYDLMSVLAAGETKISRIMTKANINYVALNLLLDNLVGKKIIEEQQMGQIKNYRLTPSGWHYLQDAKSLLYRLKIKT